MKNQTLRSHSSICASRLQSAICMNLLSVRVFLYNFFFFCFSSVFVFYTKSFLIFPFTIHHVYIARCAKGIALTGTSLSHHIDIDSFLSFFVCWVCSYVTLSHRIVLCCILYRFQSMGYFILSFYNNDDDRNISSPIQYCIISWF